MVALLASQREQARVHVFMLVVVACSLVGCSNGKGLRNAGPDASADLRVGVPDAIGCACASGIFPACQCATPDGADSMVVDSTVESDGATRMDTTPDGPDSRVADSAAESDGAAGIDTAGAVSCDDLSVTTLGGLRGVIDYACQVDADCTTIVVAGSCLPYCFLTFNVANVAAVEAALDELCQPFLTQKCKPYDIPCNSFHAPTCVAGTCRQWS